MDFYRSLVGEVGETQCLALGIALTTHPGGEIAVDFIVIGPPTVPSETRTDL